MAVSARLLALALLAASWVSAAPAGAAPGEQEGRSAAVEIRFEEGAGPANATVAVLGLDLGTLQRLRRRGLSPDEWSAVFPVWTGEEVPGPGEGRPPVLGSWRVEAERVRFDPRFPFVPGQPYVARWSPAGTEAVVARFALPAPRREPSTVVAAVYPSAGEWPENTLKVYLHFSAPMGRGEARSHVRLLDAEGEEVAGAFVATGEELWDPERTRLTLFFDPGRLKRGVGPNLEQGPPLAAGESYRLVVDPAWRDASGTPLAAGFEKSFRAAAADRVSPRPEDWRLMAPPSPAGPVALVFPEPLDHALLARLPHVVGAGGEPLAGEVEIGDGERRWSFRPAAPWAPGRYEVRVPALLEDLAGNRLDRPFETAVGAEPDPGPLPADVRLTFDVRP